MSQGLRSDQFSFSSLVLMAVSASFGSGIFFSVSVTAGYVPHPTTIMLVWLTGGVISLTGSLTFAEIGARIPETGGVYAYLRQMYGNAVAFLYGWASLLVITTGAIAALSLVFVSNLSLLISISEPMRPVAACVFIALLALVNILSNRLSSFMAVTGTLLKIGGVLLIVFTAFAVGSSKPD
ncbi:MAG: amino acid permease, partial [Flavobacteriales bacterium]|nr:amino acid permease [Flavobacteriales bacterium]